MLSRLIYGARFSLLIGLVVVDAVAARSASLLGLLAGYFRGWVDTLIMRVMDIILALPILLLALVSSRSSGPGLVNAMIADRARLPAALRPPDPRRGDRPR